MTNRRNLWSGIILKNNPPAAEEKMKQIKTAISGRFSIYMGIYACNTNIGAVGPEFKQFGRNPGLGEREKSRA